MRPALFLLLAAILCALNAPAQDSPAPAAPPQSPAAQTESAPSPLPSHKPTPPALNRRVPQKPAEDARANAALVKEVRDLKQQVQALQEEHTTQALDQIDRNANWVIGLTQIVLAVIVGMTTVLLGVAAFLTWHGFRLEKRAREAVDEIEGHKKHAKESVEETDELVRKGKDRLRILDEWKPGDKPDAKTEQAAEAVANDETAGMFDRLMANALILENEKKWKDALTMWESIVTLQPNNARALIGAAYCAGKQADNESDTAKIRILLEDACKKYEEAIKQDDAPAITWGNLGVTLLQLAGMAKGQKRRILLEKAREICKEAIKRDDMLANAWVGLGVAFEQLADTERDREKKRGLLEAARDRFEEAIKRNDTLALAWVCLGGVIGKIAGTEEDQEKKRLLWEMACEKHKEAIRRDGSLASAWCGQGVALQFLAQIARDLGESDKWLELLQQAEKMAQRANEIDSRRGAYILACIASLRGDKDKCREWLEKAEKLRDLPPVDHLEEDTDMDPVRGEAWFVALLERLRAREAAAGGEDGDP